MRTAYPVLRYDYTTSSLRKKQPPQAFLISVSTADRVSIYRSEGYARGKVPKKPYKGKLTTKIDEGVEYRPGKYSHCTD